MANAVGSRDGDPDQLAQGSRYSPKSFRGDVEESHVRMFCRGFHRSRRDMRLHASQTGGAEGYKCAACRRCPTEATSLLLPTEFSRFNLTKSQLLYFKSAKSSSARSVPVGSCVSGKVYPCVALRAF